MKKILLTTVLVSSIILSHCDKVKIPSQNDKENEKLSAQKITLCKDMAPISFDLEKKIQVLDVADPKIALSSYDDRVFVYGRSLRSKQPEVLIRIFNKNLEIVGEKTLLYGQGPGEAGPTNVLNVVKNQIYISVAANKAWNIYDSEFNFLRTKRNRGGIVGAFELVDNGNLFIDCHRRRGPKNRRFETYTFRIIDFPGMEKIRTIYKTNPFTVYQEGVVTSGRPRFVLGKNTDHSQFYKNRYIYIMFCNDYHLLKIDLEGRIIKNIKVKFEQPYLDPNKEIEYLKEYGLKKARFTCKKEIPPVSCTIPLEHGFIVTRRKDYHRNYSVEIEGDYFSYNLESKGKVSVPCFYNAGDLKMYWMLHTYKYEEQKLYLVKEEDEIVFVEKWRVTE